jgi:hypothetical protein
MQIAHLQSISSARTHELNRITFTYYATSIPRYNLRVVLRVTGEPTGAKRDRSLNRMLDRILESNALARARYRRKCHSYGVEWNTTRIDRLGVLDQKGDFGED